MRYFTIDDAGALHYLEHAEIDALDKEAAAHRPKSLKHDWQSPNFSAAFANVEIQYQQDRRDHACACTVTSAGTSATTTCRRTRSCSRYLEKKGQVTMLVKGASYLLWRGDFSRDPRLHARSPRVDALGLDRHPADVREARRHGAGRRTATTTARSSRARRTTAHDERSSTLWKNAAAPRAAVPVRLRRQGQAGAPGRDEAAVLTDTDTVRGLFVLAGLCGCYGPKIQGGSPCDPDHPCPNPLVCAATGTCETSDVDAPRLADARMIDGCVPSREICGDGIDQDCDGSDLACAPNDQPSGAIDVTAGGTFTANLNAANDDAPQKGCGGDGGRDVFYFAQPAAAEVFYFDTFGSNFDTTVRVFPGVACNAIAGNMVPRCNDDACNTSGASQLALSLPAGTSCIVIDQNAAETEGDVMLTVIPGGRDGTPLASGIATEMGDTCMSTNVSEPNITC